jgi:ABC-type sugar transport system permease subunit
MALDVQPNFWSINTFFRSLGLKQLALAGLGLSMGFCCSRIDCNLGVLSILHTLFLAGVQRIDESLYDAAKVDGAKTGSSYTM